jgi:hypothetical protein
VVHYGEQALSKWEILHYSAVEQMKKIVLFSVNPAAERLILTLEYLGKGTDEYYTAECP